MKTILRFIFIGLILSQFLSVAMAECAPNIHGEMICGMGKCERNQYGKVFCSVYNQGGAVRDGYGIVYCGIGDCARDHYGKVYCSKYVGGGAARNSSGEVKCAGECEAGRTGNCQAAGD
jgi:hypothetical protein